MLKRTAHVLNIQRVLYPDNQLKKGERSISSLAEGESGVALATLKDPSGEAWAFSSTGLPVKGS